MPFGKCPHCGVFVRPHTACPHCGREVGAIDVFEYELPVPQPKYGLPATRNPVVMGCLAFHLLLLLGALIFLLF